MWARWVELVLGLAMVFLPDFLPGAVGLEVGLTRAAGAVVVMLAGASFTRRWRRAHLGLLPVALTLLAWGWFQAPRPASPWAQGLIVTGLLLGLVALVPAPATRPPRGWTEYVEGQEG